MKRPCLVIGLVSLTQNGKDKFTVVYWKQRKTDLTYGEAAAAFGSAVMHQLACEGKLDNRAKGER